jgi:hypothetical protein
METTDANGNYGFPSVPTNFTTQPSKQDDVQNAVTALDATLVLQFQAGRRRASLTTRSRRRRHRQRHLVTASTRRASSSKPVVAAPEVANTPIRLAVRPSRQ